jgi:hypothetical protein
MFTQQDIVYIARDLLARDLDPGPRVRLLRDVLGVAPDDSRYRQARRDLQQSRWVRALKAAQEADGSWGRFHSQDTKRRTRFPTSEFAIMRGLALGLNKSDPVFRRATGYMRRVLRGQARWSDRYEKHEHFVIAVRLFTAAFLALIDPNDTALDAVWADWYEILRGACASDVYEVEAERRASLALLGTDVSGGVVGLRSVHTVRLLGAKSHQIPPAVQRAWLAHLWSEPTGLKYVETDLAGHPEDIEDRALGQWLLALETVAALEAWTEYGGDAIAWLWQQRGADGLWDFGPRHPRSASLPLSESWRKRGTRAIDCTTRLLALFCRYSGPSNPCTGKSRPTLAEPGKGGATCRLPRNSRP